MVDLAVRGRSDRFGRKFGPQPEQRPEMVEVSAFPVVVIGRDVELNPQQIPERPVQLARQLAALKQQTQLWHGQDVCPRFQVGLGGLSPVVSRHEVLRPAVQKRMAEAGIRSVEQRKIRAEPHHVALVQIAVTQGTRDG